MRTIRGEAGMSKKIDRAMDHPLTLFTVFAAQRLQDPQPQDLVAQILLDYSEDRGGDAGVAADILPGSGRRVDFSRDLGHLLLACILTVFGDDLRQTLRPGATELFTFSQEKVEQLIDLLTDRTGNPEDEEKERIRKAIEAAREQVDRGR